MHLATCMHAWLTRVSVAVGGPRARGLCGVVCPLGRCLLWPGSLCVGGVFFRCAWLRCFDCARSVCRGGDVGIAIGWPFTRGLVLVPSLRGASYVGLIGTALDSIRGGLGDAAHV